MKSTEDKGNNDPLQAIIAKANLVLLKDDSSVRVTKINRGPGLNLI